MSYAKKVPCWSDISAEWRYEMDVQTEHMESLRNTIAALTADRNTMRDDRNEHFAALVESAERIKELEAQRDRYREALNKVIHLVELYRDGVQADLVVSRIEDTARHALNQEKGAEG